MFFSYALKHGHFCKQTVVMEHFLDPGDNESHDFWADWFKIRLLEFYTERLSKICKSYSLKLFFEKSTFSEYFFEKYQTRLVRVESS